MATVIWKGDTTPIAQVVTVTVGGTVESTDVFTMTIGSKTLTVIAGSTTLATVATNIVTAWNALSAQTWPEFREITAAATSGGAFTLTHNTAGVPFTVTLATTETGGGAADAQTFTQTTTTSPDGPAFWSSAANWVGGAVPVNSDDVVIQNTGNSILYGIDQNAVTLTSLTIDRSFTGTIGLPVYNASGYREYRETYLKISATTLTIGAGIGGGSGRIKINVGSAQTTAKVLGSNQPLESGVKAVILKGTHASNSLTVVQGSVAVAPFASETSTLATLKQGFQQSQDSDTDVLLGSGVTLSSCTITKTGGTLELNSNYSALTQYGGNTTVNGSATKGTTTILGGRYYDKSTGTGTTMTAGSGGIIDKSRSMDACTYTNTTLRSGGGLVDPSKQIAFTNAVALTCALKDLATIDLGNTFNIQRS